MSDIYKLFIKAKQKIFNIFEKQFNKSIIFRSSKVKKSLNVSIDIKNEDYWQKVSKNILNASNFNGGESFFLDKSVVGHLASNNSGLGYRLLDKINSDLNGKEYLNKIRTPSYGSPFLLKKFPFLSPTTASHIANLLSIEKCFNLRIDQLKSFLDFGGGYGGLAQCITQLSNSTSISIVDISDMIEVQKKYLSKTGFLNNISFYKDLNNLMDTQFELFNASFSMSEVQIRERILIKNFIKKNCSRIHIIFQDNFNEIDNFDFFKTFADELILKNWEVKIINYDWYEWSNTRLLYGKNLNFLNR